MWVCVCAKYFLGIRRGYERRESKFNFPLFAFFMPTPITPRFSSLIFGQLSPFLHYMQWNKPKLSLTSYTKDYIPCKTFGWDSTEYTKSQIIIPFLLYHLIYLVHPTQIQKRTRTSDGFHSLSLSPPVLLQHGFLHQTCPYIYIYVYMYILTFT